MDKKIIVFEIEESEIPEMALLLAGGVEKHNMRVVPIAAKLKKQLEDGVDKLHPKKQA